MVEGFHKTILGSKDKTKQLKATAIQHVFLTLILDEPINE